MEYDPELKIDHLTSGLLYFSQGTSVFTCAIQLVPYQRVNIYGSKGWIEIQTPFSPSPNNEYKLWYGNGEKIEEVVFERCNQCTIQGDLFSKAILENKPISVPLKDAVANMRTIDALVESSKRKRLIEFK
jgi:predicted dehydrogenase